MFSIVNKATSVSIFPSHLQVLIHTEKYKVYNYDSNNQHNLFNIYSGMIVVAQTGIFATMYKNAVWEPISFRKS